MYATMTTTDLLELAGAKCKEWDARPDPTAEDDMRALELELYRRAVAAVDAREAGDGVERMASAAVKIIARVGA